MDIKAVGTNADKAANVDISKIHGGYFADENNIEAFIKIGIAPIEINLPKKLNYVDFGGGQGHLAIGIKQYLEKKGFVVSGTVADANDAYLTISRSKGLNTRLCNLESCDFPNTDLITMRAVLHYNSPDNQAQILKHIYKSLNFGGYFVHQNSSGNKENCELRSLIVGIRELGRSGEGDYHWVSENEYRDVLGKAGFNDVVHAGYAPSNSWGPDEQWERFNDDMTNKAKREDNHSLLTEIERRKNVFLSKAKLLIDDFVKKYDADYLGVVTKPDGKIVIEYQYPVVTARKTPVS